MSGRRRRAKLSHYFTHKACIIYTSGHGAWESRYINLTLVFFSLPPLRECKLPHLHSLYHVSGGATKPVLRWSKKMGTKTCYFRFSTG